MRSKTQAKRQAIVAAARTVFLERGYEAASMAEVSAKLGGSKQTLYNYFTSKAELFVAVMLENGADHAMRMLDEMRDNPDFRSSVTTFGRALLQFLMRDEVLAINRMIMAEGFKSSLGEIFYENGPKRGWTRMAEDFAARMDRGEMRRADPWRAAWHFEGLLEAGPYRHRLAGAVTSVSEDQIEGIVQDAVDVFLRAYAPD